MRRLLCQCTAAAAVALSTSHTLVETKQAMSSRGGDDTAGTGPPRATDDVSGPRSDASPSPSPPSASSRPGAAFASADVKGGSPSMSMTGSPDRLYTHTKATWKDKPAPGVAVSDMSLSGGAQSAAHAGWGGGRSPRPRGPLFVRGPPASDGGKGAAGGGSGGESGAPPGGAPSGGGGAGGKDVQSVDGGEYAMKTRARPEDGPMVPDYGPLRQTGLWSVDDVLDEAKKTVNFRKIDDVESEIIEEMKEPDEALVPYAEEERWKHKLMFVHKFKKTPKHLTWKELGEEIECMDCAIEPDEHRPEEIFTIKFFFTDKRTGSRDIVWQARNDVAYSEGFTDLLAAVGACLGRSDVHRTIRFDDGQGETHDVTLRKRSRYTSDITLSFRPPEKYNKYQRKTEMDEYETAMEAEGMSTWGYHPSLMDPEYSELDFQDPEGTYVVAMSAHGFSFIFLKAINRLLARPMKEFYRPSQLLRTAKVRTEDQVGIAHAMKGWMGIDEQIYPHFTPIEAIQDHWLGKDAPFSLVAIVNKLREMGYLKKENPEFQSWLSVRTHDTHIAIRNVGVKLLGVGASTLFMPVQHNSTVNRLLPKGQQRRLESKFSLNAVLGLPDETRKLDEFKKITGHARLSDLSERSEAPSDQESNKKPVEGTEAKSASEKV